MKKIGFVPEGSSNSNDAWITETVVFTNHTSPSGTTNSFKFDSGRITLENNIGGGTNAFTDAGWVKSLTADYSGSAGTFVSASSWWIMIHQGNDTWRAYDDVTFPDSGFAPGTNWHHVAVVYNRQGSNELFYYVDGTQQLQQTITTIDSEPSKATWGERSGGSNPLDGLMQDIYHWTSGLTSNQIYDLYASNTIPTNTAEIIFIFTNKPTMLVQDSGTNNVTGDVQLGLATEPLWRDGYYSFSPAGAGDFIRMTDSFLGLDTQFTFSVWLNPDDTDGEVVYYALSFRTNTTYSWKLGVGGSGVGGYTNTIWLADQDENIWAVTNNSWTDSAHTGSWHHIVATYDDNASPRAHFYIDGVEQTSSSTLTNITGIVPPRDELWVGRRADANWGFDGGIDDARVDDIVWTASQVTDTFNEGRK